MKLLLHRTLRRLELECRRVRHTQAMQGDSAEKGTVSSLNANLVPVFICIHSEL
jgi:hypothetical protein